MLLKRYAFALAISGLSLTAACSTGSSAKYFPAAGDNPINIASEPSGAAVYVMGEKIGETPIAISHRDVFPNIYPHGKESVYGRITLKKEGCADLTRTVSSEISSAGLSAKLDCGASAPTATPRGNETVEQRLNKIKELLGKGLISEEEAKQARMRVLGDL